jgi:hypothetical protein
MMGDPETAATRQPPDDEAQPAGTQEAPDTADTTGETGTGEAGGIQPETSGPIYKP